jgi:hypothetical protein
MTGWIIAGGIITAWIIAGGIITKRTGGLIQLL